MMEIYGQKPELKTEDGIAFGTWRGPLPITLGAPNLFTMRMAGEGIGLYKGRHKLVVDEPRETLQYRLPFILGIDHIDLT